MPASQVAMLLVAGWMLSISGAVAGDRRSNTGSRPAGQGLLLTGLIIACTQFLFAANEAREFPDTDAYREKSEILAPRFWWYGKVCDDFPPANE